MFGRRLHVLVSAATEVDQDRVVAVRLGEPGGERERVRRLQRRDDALGLAQLSEGGQRLLVGDGVVLGGA